MLDARLNNLTPGNPGNRGGGRPRDEFRRHAGERLEHWLDRSDERLTALFEQAVSFDEQMKVLEACGKLAERFGRYTGLEKAETKGDGKMVIEVVRRATPIPLDD